MSTIIKTSAAIINSKPVTVQTVLHPNDRQAISYTINGKPVSYHAFWSKNPKFISYSKG